MTETAARIRGHFATILNSVMDQLDIRIRELNKQVGTSCEHVLGRVTGCSPA
jgi:hypothetical protein